MNTYRVRGIKRDGRGTQAVLAGLDDLPEYVEAKFRARWRSLVVLTDDGEEVGRITKDDRGRRIWWAAS